MDNTRLDQTILQVTTDCGAFRIILVLLRGKKISNHTDCQANGGNYGDFRARGTHLKLKQEVRLKAHMNGNTVEWRHLAVFCRNPNADMNVMSETETDSLVCVGCHFRL